MLTTTKLKSRTEAVVERLRCDIIQQTLPPGEQLAEASVAKQLGVSRVPVREALFTLEREGLVSFTATGRAFVSDLNAKDYQELFIMRLALEPLAMRLAAPRLRLDPAALLANVAETARATSLQDVTALDLAFHDLIISACDNSRLIRLWRSLRWELDMWLGRLHRMHDHKTKGVRSETVRAHNHLIELIRTRSAAVCEQEVRLHILSWKSWLPKEVVENDSDRN